MIRWALFAVLAVALVAYAFWVYLRVDLAVPSARILATLRAVTLVTLLALLFDVQVPMRGGGGVPSEWALLDASLSMGAADAAGGSAWTEAVARAGELESSGWNVMTFGADPPGGSGADDPAPTELGSLLVPALARAAESGARRVTVLSDGRFQDAVAVRAALQTLPVDVDFEIFGGEVPNAGVSRLDVPDFSQPDQPVLAQVEVHGGVDGDSLTVQVFEENDLVATLRVPAPLPGLRARATVELPPPSGEGRVRYSAVTSAPGDAFGADDRAVDYAAVGREEGALVLVSLRPDWEPRHLLPVLREVTGLPTIGFIRAGPDRFVQGGRAIDRAGPVDSASVRRAVADAALVVIHGIDADLDAWARALVTRPGRKILMPTDEEGAALVGLSTGPLRPGEWYASADVPSSPIAGALAGAPLQGLPPLSGVLVPRGSAGVAPLLLQLRGAGAPVGAIQLEERSTGRVAVALTTGFWRWSTREGGRDAYRRLWSGVVGWLLADQSVIASEVRPTSWIVARGEPVQWNVPSDSTVSRLIVDGSDSTVVDTSFTGGPTLTTRSLEPGAYGYRVESESGDTIAAGRFDVGGGTDEMLPVSDLPVAPARVPSQAGLDGGAGRPLRTLPWPYLLVIGLLCAEWIGRRRTGLR